MTAAAPSEALLFWRYIASSLDRLVALLDGLSPADLDWRPPAPGANSLRALATHTLGNAEENLLETLGGQVIGDREAESAVQDGSAGGDCSRWRVLRSRLAEYLADLSAETLNLSRLHPRRGTITGRDILIVVARHSAEHLGQAELTRDLLLAARRRSG
ncbi:MAG: DinB family protein [Chloroflexia bacterium]